MLMTCHECKNLLANDVSVKLYYSPTGCHTKLKNVLAKHYMVISQLE